MDVRDETDRLSLTVEIQGPDDLRTLAEISNTGEPGDSAAYSVIVHFPGVAE
jgi:hypothetical protein